MHRTYIADIERGVRNVTLRSIRQLSEALQVPVETLFARANQVGSGKGATGRSNGAAEILVIEDNPSDAELIRRLFDRVALVNPCKVINSGAEAIDYLCGKGRYTKPASPRLILLDLSLPGVSGIEVLRRIRGDARSKTLPVIVLTVSRNSRDIVECGRLGVSSYIVKPVTFESLSRLTPKLQLHWALLNSKSARPR